MVAFNEQLDGQVFVLGAGFSRAIAHSMPLTDELGDELLQRDSLGRSNRKAQSFSPGTFEAWLSRRAESQPYLSAAENLENQAYFARATKLIGQILSERVGTTLSRQMPVWLGELLSLWHLMKANVITFNYDPLVECAFETMKLWDWRNASHFQWGSLLNYSPEGKPGSSVGEAGGITAPHETFRLWKMHGSLNWYWVAGDQSGATVRRGRLPGTFGAPNPVTDEELHWSAPGRERFIVPPAALKSGYYGTPITREIWNRAYRALADARKITLMGYSVPVTDLSTAGMLAEALSQSPKKFRIIDKYPGSQTEQTSIAGRIRLLGSFETQIECGPEGEDAIPLAVAEMVAAASLAAAQALVSLSANDAARSLYVDWGEIGEYANEVGRSGAIIHAAFQPEHQDLVLHTEPLSRVGHTMRSRSTEESQSVPLDLKAIQPSLASAHRVVLRVPGIDRLVPIIDFARRESSNGGHGDGRWLQLVPSGDAR